MYFILFFFFFLRIQIIKNAFQTTSNWKVRSMCLCSVGRYRKHIFFEHFLRIYFFIFYLLLLPGGIVIRKTNSQSTWADFPHLGFHISRMKLRSVNNSSMKQAVSLWLTKDEIWIANESGTAWRSSVGQCMRPVFIHAVIGRGYPSELHRQGRQLWRVSARSLIANQQHPVRSFLCISNVFGWLFYFFVCLFLSLRWNSQDISTWGVFVKD